MKLFPRLEMVVQRQRNGRQRDLLFACFIALVVSVGASTVSAHIIGASKYLAQL